MHIIKLKMSVTYLSKVADHLAHAKSQAVRSLHFKQVSQVNDRCSICVTLRGACHIHYDGEMIILNSVIEKPVIAV